MTILGTEGFKYEVDGNDWGELPEGWTYREATAVAVNSKDQIYVFKIGRASCRERVLVRV